MTVALRVGQNFTGDPVPRSTQLLDSFTIRDSRGERPSSGMTLEVTLRNASGAAIGTRTFTIRGNGFEHVQFSSALLSSQSFDEGSATFRIVSGDGSVAPYASVIDNFSSAGFFIGSQFAPNAPFASGAATFRILFDQMRTAQ
jgi:hypothetical protein